MFLRGNRAQQSDKRARKRREQDERRRRTGYVGSAVETAQIVRAELRGRGYSHGAQEYGAHLVANGGQYNFQGQFRLAQLTGVVRRTVQRYRVQLEADGLIASQLLHAGDMVDGMRAPTAHMQVVRDVSGLLALALRQPKPKASKPQPLERTAIAAPATAEERVSAEEIARYVRESILAVSPVEAARRVEHARRATQRKPISEPVRVPDGCPTTIDPAEIDQWDQDTLSLELWHEWRRQRERPPPD